MKNDITPLAIEKTNRSLLNSICKDVEKEAHTTRACMNFIKEQIKNNI